MKAGRCMGGAERGETLVSVIVTLGLTSILFMATMKSFLSATHNGYDHEIKLRAIEEASAVTDLMAFDLRMMGSGMPLGQYGFRIDDATLQPASLPILTTSTDSFISFRFNEKGSTTLLTSDFNPAMHTMISVFSGEDFKPGNIIYINNATAGGTDGFQGNVAGASGNSISLGGIKVHTPAATFRAGSLVDRVVTVSYDSPSVNSGITRDTGSGPVLLAPKSSFTITYLDMSGNPLVPPLTPSVIASSLGALRLTVTVQGDRKLKTGQTYSTQATQTVGLRNLNVSR